MSADEGQDTQPEQDPCASVENEQFLRVTALQQAVAISARGNVANTEAILKQAKQIEDFLVSGKVPETDPPATP